MKAERGVSQDVELTAEDLASASSTPSRRSTSRTSARPFPQDANAQLMPRRRRRLRVVGDAARAGLPARARHPGRPRHGREHRADGLRQQGRALGHRRRVHARPVDRRGGPVRRVPRRRPGRGRRCRHPDSRAARAHGASGCPKAYAELLETMARLEAHYRDMQDIEFTVEDDQLYILQTRTAKRTAAAALKAAVDMVGEGVITREEAVARIDPAQLDQLLHPMIDPERRGRGHRDRAERLAGRRLRRVVLDAGKAEELGRAGEAVILVRWETTPDDIHGLLHAQGVLTAHGGMTSHAAVVARGHGQAVRGRVRGARDRRRGRRRAHQRPRARRRRSADDRRRHGPRDPRRRCRSCRPRSTRTSRRCSSGRTGSAGSPSARTRTRPRTPRRRGSSAPRGSASAGPSTCSWSRSGCR